MLKFLICSISNVIRDLSLNRRKSGWILSFNKEKVYERKIFFLIFAYSLKKIQML